MLVRRFNRNFCWLAHYNRGRPHSSLEPGLPDQIVISPRRSNTRGIVSTDHVECWRTPY